MHHLPRPLAALLLLAAAPAPTDAPPARVPAATFAETPFLTQPVLSPDGKRVVARVEVDGVSSLLLFSADEPGGPKQRIGLGDTSVVGLRWAGPDRLLVTAQVKTEVYDVKTTMQRLVAIDLDTNRMRVLDRKSRGLFAGEVIYADPAGGWILVSSQDDLFSTPSVKRIDLATDQAAVVERARPDVWNWYADEAGVVRAGVAYQGDRWTIWYRDKAGAPLVKVRGRSGDGDQGSVEGVRFMTGADSGLIITNAKTGRFATYRYDFKTGAIGEPIYQNDEVDISSVMVDGTTGAVTGVSYTDDRFHIAWLDPELRAVQAKIDKALPGAENIVLNASRDGQRLLVWSGTASNPGVYFLFDRKAKRLNAIAASYDKLSDAPLAPVAPVRYPARDGLSIPGYLTLPAGRSPEKLPLIVMPHGGPHARDTWDYDPFVQFLASRGYAVLQPNFRGSTGYGKAFVERGYGQWGRAMQDDLDDGVDWLVKSGKVDPKRVCLMGGSYGGYAALWGAIRNPDRYRCAISIAGVTDLRDMLRFDRRAFSAPRYYREWEKKVMGEENQDLDAVSPLKQAARLTIPVLIAHGEKDTNVPPRQGHRMADALKGRPDVESVFYREDGHGLTKREDLVDFLSRMERFLAKHNPA